MNIIYGYSNCSDQLYYNMYNNSNKAILRPDQKYHGLLIRGLSKHVDQINCISGLPVNRTSTDRLLIRERDEDEGNIHYHYITTVNIPFLRRMMIFAGTLFNVIRIPRNKENVAICDCLNIANAYAMALGAHIKGIPIVMIVTDLPDMVVSSTWIKKINNFLFGLADGFVFLTEQMNKRLNKRTKPYIIMEGLVDADTSVTVISKKFEVDIGKKVIIYAGKLKLIYGIDILVDGFQKANIPETELWIYGDGDYCEELKKRAALDSRIKYCGVRDNAEVIEAEAKAALLVNPRPTAPEYTKYSFPSKNMEYMVSGTPVLTTDLPGMPEEYKDYVYLIRSETIDGVAEALHNVFNRSFSERCKKAEAARQFVLTKKNNILQTTRILQLFSSIKQ